jgi:hypothetical protein
MARTNETPVSWLRRLSGTLEQIIEAVEEQSGTFGHLKSFVSNPVNRRNLGKLVMGTLELAKPTQYSVTIDYAKSVEQMKSDGQYDWSNDNINGENFPITGEGVIETMLELVHFDRVVGTSEAEAELDKMGLRPATIEEILAFGAKYPEIQREFPIIALGSSWVSRFGNRFVPDLSRDGSERSLNLDWSGNQWSEICRFLAVRK